MDTPKRRITKSYTVGIPKLINFDINVSVNRKSEKRVVIPSAVSHTPDDEVLEESGVYKVKELPSSGSDDVMHNDNNTTTHSDSTEVPMVVSAQRKVVSFVASPRRTTNSRHSDKIGAPSLGSNRNGSRTAPSSPRGSVSLLNDETGVDEPMISPRNALSSTPLPMMRSPRQSLYPTAVGRRQRDISMPNFRSSAIACKLETLSQTTEAMATTPVVRLEPIQRSITEYGRDIDGFINELSNEAMFGEENKEKSEIVVTESASFGDTYESVVFEEEKIEERTTKLFRNELLYGDILPSEHVNHDAILPYNNGVVNLRYREYEIDHPITNFCFHCDRNLLNTHFRRQLCLTEHKPDLIYGMVRCRVYRDINLCSECFHTSDLAFGVITVTTRAKNFFHSMYPV